MWICQYCHEKHEDVFASCWNYGTEPDLRGAETFAKIKSIFATLQARKLDMVTGFQEVMETGKMPSPKS